MNKCLERVNGRQFWNPGVFSYAMIIIRCHPNLRIIFLRHIYSLCLDKPLNLYVDSWLRNVGQAWRMIIIKTLWTAKPGQSSINAQVEEVTTSKTPIHCWWSKSTTWPSRRAGSQNDRPRVDLDLEPKMNGTCFNLRPDLQFLLRVRRALPTTPSPIAATMEAIQT